jgi:hypothetical protein
MAIEEATTSPFCQRVIAGVVVALPTGGLPQAFVGGVILVLSTTSNSFAAGGAPSGPSEALFFAQVGLLLVAGRLLGEAMQRLGQPAVMGQLLAGMILGPSVFGPKY